MDLVLSRIRREVERVLRLVAEPRMARVTSFDPVTHAIKATVLPEGDFPLQPGDVAETGWIPMGPVAGGANWGISAPPLPGTQVMLTHSEHRAGAPVGVTTVHDQANPAPGAQAGEIWLMHSSGQCWLKFTNDKNASMQVYGTLTQTVMGDLDLTVTGTLNVSAATANIDAATVNLGAAGGRAVARIGDAVSGGTITTGSSMVFSA